MSFSRISWTVITTLTLGLMLLPGSNCIFAASPQEQVLWSFGGPGDGITPSNYASLIVVGGKLYGTTEFGGANYIGPPAGTAFQLTPPAQDQKSWSESVLWSFADFASRSDGSSRWAA